MRQHPEDDEEKWSQGLNTYVKFSIVVLVQVTHAVAAVATKSKEAGELPPNELNLCSVAVSQCSLPV